MTYTGCMTTATMAFRQTKYCQALESLLAECGHATNAQLLARLREHYPELSATTVHRATARLAQRGVIATAPATIAGTMRYDTNRTPHDHFMCSACGMLRDTDVKDQLVSLLESSIADCHISGRLTISGKCTKCKGEE